MNYIVYKTTNIINSKIYIGVHYTNPDINDGYIGCGVTKKDLKKKTLIGFPAAVRKYGYHNFRREILFIFPDTEEGRLDAYKKEEELVTPEFVARKDTYNLNVGGLYAQVDRWKKKISQYTLDGKFIKVWRSITAAENALGLCSISANVCGISKYCGEYQWKYYTDENDIPPVQTKEHTVYQFDLQGNLVQVHKSLTIAASQFANSESARNMITRCCKGLRQQVYGYYWSYKNKFEYAPKYYETELPVAKYNDAGEFIESYTSVKHAAEENNIAKYVNIMSCIRGYSKHCGGYRWRFFYGNKSNIKSL